METQKLSFEDFKNIIVERLGCEPEQVTMDASFQEDLNADSLDLVELIYAFEENTGLEIPDETPLRDVQDWKEPREGIRDPGDAHGHLCGSRLGHGVRRFSVTPHQPRRRCAPRSPRRRTRRAT